MQYGVSHSQAQSQLLSSVLTGPTGLAYPGRSFPLAASGFHDTKSRVVTPIKSLLCVSSAVFTLAATIGVIPNVLPIIHEGHPCTFKLSDPGDAAPIIFV